MALLHVDFFSDVLGMCAEMDVILPERTRGQIGMEGKRGEGKYPVLYLLHGMSDDIVASGYSVRAVNLYPHANLELIGEVGHGFTGGAFKYAVRKIVGFLDEEADLPDESGLNGDLNFKGGGMFG